MEQYTKLKELGSGAAGVVTLVRRRNDGRLFAAKEIYTANDHTTNRGHENASMSSHAEVAMMNLPHHPGIITVEETLRTRTGIVLVLEYVQGGSMADYLTTMQEQDHTEYKSEMLVPEERVVQWLRQCLNALHHCHEHSIAHRDIKPANLLLTNQNTCIKISDFGVSTCLLQNGVDGFAKTSVGTPTYMPPEIMEEEPYSVKCDIWSLGVSFFELCTLGYELPFSGHNILALSRSITEDLVPPLVYPPASCGGSIGVAGSGRFYSKGLEFLLQKMMTKDASQRPNAPEMLVLVKQYSKGTLDITPQQAPQQQQQEQYDNAPPVPPLRQEQSGIQNGDDYSCRVVGFIPEQQQQQQGRGGGNAFRREDSSSSSAMMYDDDNNNEMRQLNNHNHQSVRGGGGLRNINTNLDDDPLSPAEARKRRHVNENKKREEELALAASVTFQENRLAALRNKARMQADLDATSKLEMEATATKLDATANTEEVSSMLRQQQLLIEEDAAGLNRGGAQVNINSNTTGGGPPLGIPALSIPPKTDGVLQVDGEEEYITGAARPQSAMSSYMQDVNANMLANMEKLNELFPPTPRGPGGVDSSQLTRTSSGVGGERMNATVEEAAQAQLAEGPRGNNTIPSDQQPVLTTPRGGQSSLSPDRRQSIATPRGGTNNQKNVMVTGSTPTSARGNKSPTPMHVDASTTDSSVVAVASRRSSSHPTTPPPQRGGGGGVPQEVNSSNDNNVNLPPMASRMRTTPTESPRGIRPSPKSSDDLKKMGSFSNTTSSVPCCKNCGIAAEWLCPDCDALLCDSCSNDIHGISMFQTHSLYAVTKPSHPPQPQRQNSSRSAGGGGSSASGGLRGMDDEGKKKSEPAVDLYSPRSPQNQDNDQQQAASATPPAKVKSFKKSKDDEGKNANEDEPPRRKEKVEDSGCCVIS